MAQASQFNLDCVKILMDREMIDVDVQNSILA